MRIETVEIWRVDLSVALKGDLTTAESETFVAALSAAAGLDFGPIDWFDDNAFSVLATNTVRLDQAAFVGFDDKLRRLVFDLLGQDRVRDTRLAAEDVTIHWEPGPDYYDVQAKTP